MNGKVAGRERTLALALLLASAACTGGAAPGGAPAPMPGAAVGGTPPAPGAAAPRAADTVEPPPIQAGVAPPPGPYAPGFDALHYELELALPDTGSFIRARVQARIALLAPRPDTLPLDLTGLAVDSVKVGGAPAGYRYAAGKLRVALPPAARVGDVLAVEVQYHGHPDDGLIIGPNVHGERAAFADNWPNRARFWFPCIDHPSDKATFAVKVAAPEGWQVVSNGDLPGDVVLFRDPWRERYLGNRLFMFGTHAPIPTYTMVVGAAHFGSAWQPPLSVAAYRALAHAPVPVFVHLFPQDSAGRRSFRRATDIVAFYSALIAPFPYEKLDHVESSTKFGGMENAGAIFYDQKAIAAGMNIEGTVAHETAHQWFGDAVTESDWHHLWLSEGFATYFGALFFEHADGEDRFRAELRRSRAQYLASADTARPVIDPAEQDLFALLNDNNYQKGAWVLHMLRGQLGDSAFFQGIRTYYREHARGNALTEDLQRALERASGQELGWFFRQWLYQPGYPRLRLSWRWLADANMAEVTLRQVQPASWPAFRLPLELELATPSGRVRRTVQLTGREETFRVAAPAAPTAITVDPDQRLLLVVER